MKLENLNKWLTLIANFGVIAGIVFLGLEVQQNMVLIRAEMMSNDTDAWIAIDSSKQDEQFALVLAKSMEQPHDLTLAEMIQLDGNLIAHC